MEGHQAIKKSDKSSFKQHRLSKFPVYLSKQYAPYIRAASDLTHRLPQVDSITIIHV